MAAFMPHILLAKTPRVLANAAYLNVSHTDYDLSAHWNWIARNKLRPVYFIHDLIPIRHPEFSRPHAVRRHSERVRAALREAAGIVVSSQGVADDLRAFACEEQLSVPPITLAPIAGHSFAAAAPMNPGLPQPYFLTIGTIEPRKNHALLFDIWRVLVSNGAAPVPRLVIVGQKGPMSGALLDALSDPALAPYIEHREHCTDTELTGLLAHAHALLMPSLAEGFGLPLVEALEQSTAVLASDIPVFAEIAQGAAQLIDPADPSAWLNAISQLQKNATEDRQTAQFDPPTWPDHFALVDAAIGTPALKSAAACESSLAA